MKKILFVCLGNICRSPLAEGVMLHLRDSSKLKLQIDSAGTAGYHIGEAPDRRTTANAKKNGIDLSALRARQFSKADLDAFDSIFVMDHHNMKNVLAMANTEAQKQKVRLLLDLLPQQALREVPDPYYGAEKDFEQVFQLIYKACEALASQHAN